MLSTVMNTVSLLLILVAMSCNFICYGFMKNSNLQLLATVKNRLGPSHHNNDRCYSRRSFSPRSSASYSTTRSYIAVYTEASINDSKKKYTLEGDSKKPSSISSITLPELSENELKLLNNGEIIQGQKRDGSAGSGWVVMDVDACPHLVFSSLVDFDSYAKMIPTVRSVKVYQSDRDMEQYKVEYCLSKFRLKTNVEHIVDHDEKIIRFSLDRSRSNLVFKKADGFWFIQADPSNASRCRVWLYASIVCSRIVPTWIVDYAACRALPRATNWIRPHFSTLQQASKGSGSSILG